MKKIIEIIIIFIMKIIMTLASFLLIDNNMKNNSIIELQIKKNIIIKKND